MDPGNEILSAHAICRVGSIIFKQLQPGEHDILNFVCLLESKLLLPSIFVFGAIFNKLVRKYWRTLTLNDPSVFARSLITYILYTLIGYPWPGSIVVRGMGKGAGYFLKIRTSCACGV